MPDNPCQLCIYDNPNINLDYKQCEFHCNMRLGELFVPREPRDSYYSRHHQNGDCEGCVFCHWFRGCERMFGCVKDEEVSS